VRPRAGGENPGIAIVAAFVTVALAVLALAPAGVSGEALEATSPAREVGFDQKLGAQIPLSLEFRDDAGRTVRLGDYFGQKAVVIQLVYYECPMICGLAIEGLAKSLKAVGLEPGSDFTIVTVSFNPRETPEQALQRKEEALRVYGDAGLGKSWHFLVGRKEEILSLTSTVGFRYAWDEEQQQFAHATGIVIATPDGRVARYFFGVEHTPRDMKFGLIEASGGEIGSFTDQLLLLCYHYNPTTGRYGMIAMTSIRVGGAITVVVLGGFVLLMLLRERRRSRAGALAEGA